MDPRISLGLPVYNGEPYLREALDSVLAQDEPAWELVISDNGSDDGTEEICRELAAADARVRYVRQAENRGGSWNFQHVLDEARAPSFAWLCADDRKAPSFASACLEALDATGPDTVMAYPRTRLIDAVGEELGLIGDDRLALDGEDPVERVRRLLRAQASPIFYGVVRTAAARRTRGIRPCIASDIAFLVEIACQGRLRLVDEVALDLRIHEAQASAQGSGQAAFYRTSGGSRFAFQHSRANKEILGGVVRSALDPGAKARASAAVWSSWIVPRWRAVARDVLTLVAPPARR